MALPTQGGLGQASAQPSPAKFDVDAAQATNLNAIQPKPTGITNYPIEEVADQREALNSILIRLRASLDSRKNQLFDPVLMQTAAGFLRPTKTGSFGESLGSAAEGAGAAYERKQLHDRENEKLEMELAQKEMELRQQLGSDQFVSALLGGSRSTAPAPAGGAVATPTGQLRVPDSTSPIAAAPNPQQVLAAAQQGRIKITDEVLLMASRVAPKILPSLQEIRKSQEGEEKNAIERQRLETTTRKLIPRGLRTEREMNAVEYAEYQKSLQQYLIDGDENKLMNFYDRKGYLEPEQVRGRKITPAGEASAPIPRAKSISEIEGEKEASIATAKERATAAEKQGSKLLLQADSAYENTNIAMDMKGYAINNPAVFALMNQPGLGNAIARAVEQGVTAGNFNISLPASVVLQYKLSANDLTTLQMFMQKNAQLQSRGRQLNRTPGEGAISDYETKLLGGIYALPSDSARAIILKSNALEMQSAFDVEKFKLWNKKSKESGYNYNDFIIDDDFKTLKDNYRKVLDKVREDNMDLLSPKKKTPEGKSAASKPQPATDSSVPPGYVRDATGMIRKKRQGE